MNLNSKIYVAGHTGLVGSAIVRELQSRGYSNIITASREEIDLTNSNNVLAYFQYNRPEYVFLAAAKVGGILANNNYPVDFILDNMKIQNNIIEQSFNHKVKKLLFLGSSCIYPKFAEQPISESSLLTGLLEPTNEWYAIAKISGIKLCQAYNKQYKTNFVSVMPTNLYGPNDHYNVLHSHVLPALIRKFHDAKLANLSEITCWGTGAARREFLHVDDFAKACMVVMEKYNSTDIINVGSGSDISIASLVNIIKQVVGYNGAVNWDLTKPDGTPRKLLDSSKINSLGWKPSIEFSDGVAQTYSDFLNSYRL